MQLLLLNATLGLACFLAWALPLPKTDAAFGRLSYPQFVLAAAATLAFAVAAAVSCVPCRHRKRVGFRVVAVVGGTLVVLVPFECYLVWRPLPHYLDDVETPVLKSELPGEDDLPYVRTPHSNWRGMAHGDLASLYGDVDRQARLATFTTDADGFRNDRDLDQADLLFVGDSFTEAGETPLDQTFPALVAGQLQASFRNLGRFGYSPSTELVVLRRFGLKLRPKAVVWQVCEANDLNDESKYRHWRDTGEPYFREHNAAHMFRRNAWKRRSATYRLFNRYRQRVPWPLAVPLDGTYFDAQGIARTVRFTLPAGEDQRASTHAGWPLMADALRRGAAVLKEQDVALVVLLVPMKFRVLREHVTFHPTTAEVLAQMPDLPPAETQAACLRTLCRELDARFVDATPALKGAVSRRELPYREMDTHLSPVGHGIVARLVADAVAGELER